VIRRGLMVRGGRDKEGRWGIGGGEGKERGKGEWEIDEGS
jgi:hypothetical protein